MGFKTTGLDSICRGQSGENANISIMIGVYAIALVRFDGTLFLLLAAGFGDIPVFPDYRRAKVFKDDIKKVFAFLGQGIWDIQLKLHFLHHAFFRLLDVLFLQKGR
jgi:hypothetical protein